MKIELKKIAFYERMSEETNCFTADLYINGRKVGYVKNDGQGGQTDYRGYTKEDNAVIQEAEAYCKTLPKVKYDKYEWDESLEHMIDTMFETHILAKEQKKKEKKMQTSILVGIPNGSSYNYYNLKRPLSSFPINYLQGVVDDIIGTLKAGEVILNTNLAELGIKV